MKVILKKLMLLTLIIVAGLPKSPFAHGVEGYEITGKVNGFKDGDKIVMLMLDYKDSGVGVDKVRRDSAIVKNGQFHVTGNVPNGPRTYWLIVNEGQFLYRMYIDNGQHITLTSAKDVSSYKMQMLDKYITCSGSPTTYGFHLIWAMSDGFDSIGGIDHELKKIKAASGFNKDAIDALMNAKIAARETFDRFHFKEIDGDVLPSAAFLVRYFDGHDLSWQDVYNQMDDHMRNSVDGKFLQRLLPLLNGKEMPSFSLPDYLGKDVQLKDVAAKGKVTIVRFWATNSFNRRSFDNELRAMYKLYHDKGLNIIGVSTDSYEEQWKETIAKEAYPWINVFDGKGQKVVDPVYHELGEVDHQNTTNVVLDANGRIVAWDPTGPALQYYILKTLGE